MSMTRKMGVGLVMVMVGILVGIKEKGTEMMITREDEAETREDEAGVGEDGAGEDGAGEDGVGADRAGEDEVGIATVPTVARAGDMLLVPGHGEAAGEDEVEEMELIGYSLFWKYLVLLLTTLTIILGLGTINTFK